MADEQAKPRPKPGSKLKEYYQQFVEPEVNKRLLKKQPRKHGGIK